MPASPRKVSGSAPRVTASLVISRNRQVGLELGRGRELTEIVAGMHQVAEGIRTTRAACALADLHKVEMPITRGVGKVLDGEIAPGEVVLELMSRQLRNENE